MLGAIIGDIVGSRFEFNNTDNYNFELFTEESTFTDDTICTIAIADAINNGEHYEDTLLKWCRKYPNPKGAYGSSFARWIASDTPQPYNSFGNGSAMRVSPVAWFFDDLYRVKKEAEETAITITVGDTVLDGVLYDTPLANEIREYFPLTVSMVGFGGREYYGGVDFYPENWEGGQTTFENGHITYCEDHHNMAIFYAQTDDPILSVEVSPIGMITSDLSVFEELPRNVDVTFALAE